MRESFRDVEHLIRVAGLFALGFVVFLGARAMFVPADFGVYGFFRAGALDDIRSRTPVYAGREACAECHDDVVTARKGSAHERVGCEACHGPLGAHAADPGALVPERPDGATICLRCHRAGGSKPEWFPQVDPQAHAGGDACNACHAPHHPELD